MAVMRAEIHARPQDIDELPPGAVWTARGKGLGFSAKGPHRSGESNNYHDNSAYHSFLDDSYWCWCLGGRPHPQTAVRARADAGPRQPPGDMAKLAPPVGAGPLVRSRFEGDDKASAKKNLTQEKLHGLRRWYLASGYVGSQVKARPCTGIGDSPWLPVGDFCSTNVGRSHDGRVFTTPKMPRDAIKLMGTSASHPSKTLIMAAKLSAARVLAPQKG